MKFIKALKNLHRVYDADDWMIEAKYSFKIMLVLGFVGIAQFLRYTSWYRLFHTEFSISFTPYIMLVLLAFSFISMMNGVYAMVKSRQMKRK